MADRDRGHRHCRRESFASPSAVDLITYGRHLNIERTKAREVIKTFTAGSIRSLGYRFSGSVFIATCHREQFVRPAMNSSIRQIGHKQSTVYCFRHARLTPYKSMQRERGHHHIDLPERPEGIDNRGIPVFAIRIIPGLLAGNFANSGKSTRIHGNHFQLPACGAHGGLNSREGSKGWQNALHSARPETHREVAISRTSLASRQMVSTWSRNRESPINPAVRDRSSRDQLLPASD